MGSIECKPSLQLERKVQHLLTLHRISLAHICRDGVHKQVDTVYQQVTFRIVTNALEQLRSGADQLVPAYWDAAPGVQSPEADDITSHGMPSPPHVRYRQSA